MRRWIRKVVPPGLRAAIRDRISRGRELTGKASVWRWTLALVRGTPFDLVYAGRSSLLPSACALVAPWPRAVSGSVAALAALRHADVVVISDAPLPRALRVPSMLRTILPAEPEAMALSSRQRALAAQYRQVRVTDERAVERINCDMLEPFATARHGAGAVQLPLETVKSLAKIGRLDVLVVGGEEVGALLAYPLERGGKKYWVVKRIGHPPHVFSDPRRLADTNIINWWLGLHQARDLEFDFYDMGAAVARPEDGALQWKRQRGGSLDAWGMYHQVWILPPPGRAPAFLWASPLFSLERRGITLNVGVPAAATEGEILQRFGRLRFGGLAAVRIHPEATVPAPILQLLRRKYGAVPIELAASRSGAPAPLR